jgi:RHS repeat-associated protein
MRGTLYDEGVGSRCNGKERDEEDGNYYYGARYYASFMGRFMTPDWAAKPTAVPYAHFGNPQSLNLYSYVQNNPTTLGDPDGHCGEPNGTPGGGTNGCVDTSKGTDPQNQAKAPEGDTNVATTLAAVQRAAAVLQSLANTVNKAVDAAKNAVQVSAAVQGGNAQVDTNGKVSAVGNVPGIGVTGTVNINGASGDQKLIAQPSVSASKLVSVGTDVVQESNGDVHAQGVSVSLGLSTPQLPVSVTVPLDTNYGGNQGAWQYSGDPFMMEHFAPSIELGNGN